MFKSISLLGRTAKHHTNGILSILIGISISLAVVLYFEMQLRPIITTIAQTQTVNLLSSTITLAISNQNLDYSKFTTIERNQAGAITALTTDMSEINQMRHEMIMYILEALDDVDISVIEVPLGSLFSVEFLWAKGPSIKARSLSVGTVSAEFDSQFTQAGINQTLHRIYVAVEVPITLILAGDIVSTEVITNLCVSEIVIVGTVPDTNLQMDLPYILQ